MEPPPRSPPSAPGDYTPRHLAEKILSSRAAIEGERKHVTVLFADIQGSMSMSETLDPETWHGIMDRFFAIMTNGVHRFEGTVNQYTGDGVMALFGAPIAHEDHAHRACFAALHLQEALRAYANTLRLEHGLALATRIGMNSGAVVVGRIGDDLRMDYTAQGHTVGLAARMQQIAEPGRTTLTGATEALVRGYFALSSLGRTAVKGSSNAVEVFTLDGPGELRTRLDVSRARGLSKFIGRDRELAMLQTALVEVAAGNGQIVGVVAEAGTGKSRLCEEFLARCRDHGVTTYVSYCLPHGRAMPLFPLMQLYRSVFGLEDTDTPQRARDKIAGRTVLVDPGLVDTLPLLFDFLGVPDPARPAPSSDPDASMRRIIEVLRRFTLARGEHEPVVVLLEDLHWIDAGSAAFLDQLIDVVPSGRVLLIGNFRPEYDGSWTRKSYYRQVPLNPLGDEEVGELLQHLLGRDPSLQALASKIAQRTGGNPFFVEELVRELAESGYLSGAPGDYTLAHDITVIPVPSSVQGVLAARIDRLDELTKEALQSASAIGRKFPLKLLAVVMNRPESALEPLLAQLVDHEFVFPRALYPERDYEFKHALTRDVAYESLLGERRRQLHAALAQWLDTEVSGLDPATGGESAALVAHHYEQAGHQASAAIWHERAADWIGIRNAAESVQHLDRARDLLGALAATPEINARLVRVCCQVVARGLRVGMELDVPVLLAQARSALAGCDDLNAEARLLSTEGSLYYFKGDFGAAFPLLDASVATARKADNPHTLGLVLSPWLVVQSFRDPGDGLALLDQIGDVSPSGFGEAAGFQAHGWSHCWRGVYATYLGRYPAATAALEHALDRAHRGGDAVDLALTMAVASSGYNLWGDTDRARALQREARRLAEACSVRIAIATACMSLAQTLEPGGWDAPELDPAGTYERLQQLELGLFQLYRMLLGAQIAFATQRWAVAVGHYQALLGHAEESGARVHVPKALLGLAESHLALSGGTAQALIVSLLDRTLAAIDSLGLELFRPYVHRVHAKLALAAGSQEAVRARLEQAAACFDAMGAPMPAGFARFARVDHT